MLRPHYSILVSCLLLASGCSAPVCPTRTAKTPLPFSSPFRGSRLSGLPGSTHGRAVASAPGSQVGIGRNETGRWARSPPGTYRDGPPVTPLTGRRSSSRGDHLRVRSRNPSLARPAGRSCRRSRPRAHPRTGTEPHPDWARLRRPRTGHWSRCARSGRGNPQTTTGTHRLNPDQFLPRLFFPFSGQGS